jgi:Ser/Thr protein kinase RdoA (MazF antagonist)
VSPIEVAHSLATGAAIAAVAAEGYDLGSPLRAWLISRGLTDHYAVEGDGQRYVLRLYPIGWRSRADVLFELDLVRHAAARGVPVAAPLPRRDGGWLTEVDAAEGLRLAVLFAHAAGDEWVPRHEREEHAAAYGAAVARLHNACDDFVSDQPRFALDLTHLLERPLATLGPFLHDRPDDQRYLRALGALLSARVGEAAGDLRWQVCHGDLHGGNAHRQPDGRLVFFDFDCCGMGYAAYEIAVFRWESGFGEPQKPEPHWERFLDSYRAHRPIGAADLAATDYFVPVRHIWWMGLQAGGVDRWGSRRWVNDRFFDENIRHLVDWCDAHVPGAPTWSCVRPRLSS